MNTNKLPNLGSKGWGKSLNDYIEGIETRVSDIEDGLSEAREPEKVFNISSGVVGFGGKMKQGGEVLYSGDSLTNETCFWEGDVFFKDIGDGSPLNVTMDENTNLSPGALVLEIGWNPVYLFFNDDGNVTYRVDSTNAYLTHPLVILLGFIFYDGSEKYWYYKTSRSEENTYEKRFMLTRPLAKFNSTFSVGVNGNRYAIIGKKVGTANPTLTLNAMGINYENSSISSEELVRGPDYKEFTVKENTPIIWATTNSITFGTSEGFKLSSDRSIHRVYFSNIGYYVRQSEKYNGNDDYSSVVSYGFQPMNTNLERYGDLVEVFRFVTVGAEEEGDFINVYQAIGSGIPPVDSFGVVPEVNYVSKENSNGDGSQDSNIRFTNSDGNYFTLAGRNYNDSPRKVFFDFTGKSNDANNIVLMNNITLPSEKDFFLEVPNGNNFQMNPYETVIWRPGLQIKLQDHNRKMELSTLSGAPSNQKWNSIVLGANTISLGSHEENNGTDSVIIQPNSQLWTETPSVNFLSDGFHVNVGGVGGVGLGLGNRTIRTGTQDSRMVLELKDDYEIWPLSLSEGRFVPEEINQSSSSSVLRGMVVTDSHGQPEEEEIISSEDVNTTFAWYNYYGSQLLGLWIDSAGGQGGGTETYYLALINKEGSNYRVVRIQKMWTRSSSSPYIIYEPSFIWEFESSLNKQITTSTSDKGVYQGEREKISIRGSSINIDVNERKYSNGVRITSDNILIRTKKKSWPEELISSMEYVFDPWVYGGILLRDRYMGTQYDLSPVEGGEANSYGMDINQAFYKTADNHWCLGLWGGQTHLGGPQTRPSTYLVVIRRPSEEEEYKFDFVKKVEGYAPTDKENSFVFSVSPHDTCSLTGAWRNEENDAFYQRGKVTIKSESRTDIDSALSVLGNLEVGGDILTTSLGGLQIGSPNYKLVFLNDVNLVTTRLSPHDNLPGANLYWTVYIDGEITNERYLLNNFPVLGQNVFNLSIWWDDLERNAYWSGNFPVQFSDTIEGGVTRSLVVVKSFGWVTLAIYTPSTGETMGELSVAVKLDSFTGWAWEVVPQGT